MGGLPAVQRALEAASCRPSTLLAAGHALRGLSTLYTVAKRLLPLSIVPFLLRYRTPTHGQSQLAQAGVWLSDITHTAPWPDCRVTGTSAQASSQTL